MNVILAQGAKIKHLESGPDGRVAAVKLEDGSSIESDTVKQRFLMFFEILIITEN